MDTEEVWKDIPGFEGSYAISDKGRVKSLDRVCERVDGTSFNVKERILKPSVSKRGGYKRVQLYRAGVYTTLPLHRGVLLAFVGPPEEGQMALHNDGDTLNNHQGNLRWGTPSENMYDRARHGTDHNRNKESCPLGHRLEDPNLQSQKLRLGYRCCRACHQAGSDLYNGSALTFQQASDARYYMNPRGLRYPHGKRKEMEMNMWRLANERRLD